ncbi:MAG: hypothetical protein DRZ82_06075 [Thermoprotei archaeon]|nr:MAG: hypothetical protein DRZ82_06075 [Thermoprotei archaeon]
MTLKETLNRVRIMPNGAIVMDNILACDGHSHNAILRVITHAHSDHIIDLSKSVRFCRYVISTPVTFDLITVLKGIKIRRKIGLSYDIPFNINDYIIVLKRARHIPGAAQVFLESPDGITIGYTGDFKLPGTPSLDVDILVTEATYGMPNYVRPPPEIIEQTLFDLVRRSLRVGPVTILGYHGKLQEVMELLRKEFPEVPFLASKRVYLVSQVVRRHGMNIYDIWPLNSLEGREIEAYGHYIFFDHIMSRRQGRGIRIYLSGWLFNKPMKKIASREYIVAFSDHADFNQLLEYITSCSPKIVIVDSTRSSCAPIFAKEVRKRLNLTAISLPR